MTKEYREYAKSRIEYLLKISRLDERDKEALEAAIQALSQEPCQLLIIKSDILLHQDDTKKWMDNIKRGKEDGVIILPPYFEPLLVPADIEINIEQEPCDDAISREAVLSIIDGWYEQNRETENIEDLIILITYMDSVTPKSRECEDVISRAEVKRIVDFYKEQYDGIYHINESIEKLPSVNPQPICEEREKGECPYYAG